MREHINYYRFCPVSTVNGPGRRAVLWVQGCLFRCPGCFNRESWDMQERILESVDIVYKRVMDADSAEGITFSGGEPFLQAEALSVVAERLKSHGLSVMTYTGFTTDELENLTRPGAAELAEISDILVTGRYRAELPPDRMWIGSANQEVVFRTQRYKHFEGSLRTDGRQFEVICGQDGEVLVTGFIPAAARRAPLVGGSASGVRRL